mgnify:FL=1
MTRTISATGYEYFTNEDGSAMAVNLKTGEVTEARQAILPVGSWIMTPEDIAAHNKRKRQQREFFLQKQTAGQLGTFCFLAINNGFHGLHPSTAARLIYLSTFLRYGTDSLYITKRTPMKIADLQKVTGLSNATIRRFLDEVCPSYLTIDDCGDMHINTSVFRRGTLPKKDGLGAYQKVYIEAVRNLYRATPISNHKQLGYIFLMLPYINIQYNVLCKNPYEPDIASIEPLTVREFCELIGHSYSTVARLREAYSRIRFAVNGQQELFCAFVYDGNSLDDARIFVNPHIFYSGTDPERVEVLGHFCKSHSKACLQF